jgi:hypothetical protein
LDATLNISAGSGFAAGPYTLFTYGGNFSGSPVLGTKPPGYNYTLDTSMPGLIRLLVQQPVTNPPSFNAAYFSGSSFVMGGTGGVTNGTYYVLASSNLTAPITSWTRIATNPFDSAGRFSYTNNPAPGTPRLFYLVQIP